MFILWGGAISWRSVKQSNIADSTMEVEYIAAKEAVWLKNFLMDLEVVPSAQSAITLFYDKSEWLQIQRSQGAIRQEST